MAQAPLQIQILEQAPPLPENSPLFGSSSWWDFQKAVWGADLFCLVASQGSNLVAWCFLLRIKRGIWTRMVHPPYTPYGGPYFNHSALRQSFNEALADREKIATEMIHFLSSKFDDFLLVPQEEISRPFAWAGWEIKPRYTMITDLSQVRTKDFHWNRSIRRNLQKAQELTINLDAPYEQNCLRVCAELLRRKDVSLVGGEILLEKWIQIGTKMGILKLIQVCQNQWQAWLVYSLDLTLSTAFTHLIGSDPQIQDLGSQYLLYDRAVHESAVHVNQFDFCGADAESISEFKAKFSHELKVHSQIGYCQSSALKYLRTFLS